MKLTYTCRYCGYIGNDEHKKCPNDFGYLAFPLALVLSIIFILPILLLLIRTHPN